MPVVQNAYWSVVAEDGSKYPYPRVQYNVYLAPGKTNDVIFQPSVAGTYPVYDRRLHLTTGGAGGGGLLAHLEVLSAGGGSDRGQRQLQHLRGHTLVRGGCTGRPRNDTGDRTDGRSSPRRRQPASLTWSPINDGSFTYTPNPNFNGTDSFTYQATDGIQTSAPATVQIIVAPQPDAPVATADAYPASRGPIWSSGCPGYSPTTPTLTATP